MLEADTAISSLLPDLRIRGLDLATSRALQAALKRGKISAREIAGFVPKGKKGDREFLAKMIELVSLLSKAQQVHLVTDKEEPAHRERYPIVRIRTRDDADSVPASAFDAFKLELQRARKLEDEEVHRHAEAARAGDDAARLQLLTSSLREVLTVAYGWYTGQVVGETGFHVLDLVQEGAIGVWTKLPKFSGTTRKELREFTLETAKQGIKEALASAGLTVALNKEVAQLLRKVNRAWAQLFRETKKPPHPYEVAELIGVPGLKVAELMETTRISVRPTRSLDAPLLGRSGSEIGTLHDFVHNSQPTPEEALVEKETEDLRQKLQDALEAAFKALSPTEQYVLALRFGFGSDRLTRCQIAEVLGTFEERVFEIEVEALAKLRADRTINECKIAVDGRPRVTAVKFSLPRMLSRSGDDEAEELFVIHRHAWEEAELSQAILKEEMKNNRFVRGHLVREGLIPARAWYRRTKK